MNKDIFPCLWFDGKAKEAAEFYCSIFSNSAITAENPMVVQFKIEGKTVMGLNGGPQFKINPSISFFVTCQTNEEIENTWERLSEAGMVMMALNKYPWSEKYGWVADKFGMTWQLMLGELPADGQKIIQSFLFSNEQYGRAQEAMKFYTTVFPDSKIDSFQLYEAGEPQGEGKLKFGRFTLSKNTFSAMDGPGDHQFKFNEALSLVVECDTQEEIDSYWDTLTKDGRESMCGWLVDKFGVSWQIVPKIIGKLMADPAKGGKVMQEIMKMKKLDIETLKNA